MMGERDPQKQLWSYQVNLDQRVRSDHPLRRINETLELDFVRREVAKFYGTKGNVSEDPVVIMKMMLLLFVDSVRSERELMRIIPERLDYMWFLGYGLDDTIPNHSVLSKARKRWGQEVFVAVFSRVVAQCVRAGLVEGTKIHAPDPPRQPVLASNLTCCPRGLALADAAVWATRPGNGILRTLVRRETAQRVKVKV